MKKRTISSILLAALLCGTVFGASSCGGADGKKKEETTVSAASTETESDTEETKKAGPSRLKGDSEMTEKIRFFGRTYAEKGAVYFNWSLSGFTFRFRGTEANAKIVTNLGYDGTSPANNGMLYVFIDDSTEGRLLRLDRKENWYTLAEGLAEAEHTIRVVKRTEVGYSTAGLSELTVDGELLSPPAAKERRIEIIGDSFSCGDGCYTVAGADAYVSENQNAMESYARRLADMLEAEVNVIAKCGIGLVWDYAGKTKDDGSVAMTQVYEYTDYFRKGTDLAWDFSAYRPDLIIVNLGTNDSAYIPRDKNLWVNTYMDFLRMLRSHNPEAAILCTQGATNCFTDLVSFRTLSRNVEKENLPGIYFYTMVSDYNAETDGVGVGMHPSPAVHQKTAEQLFAEIRRLGIFQ